MQSATVVATTGTTEVIAAPARGRIRVLGFSLSSRTAINEVNLKSASTTKVNWEGCAQAGGSESWPVTEGYFDCGTQEALNVTLSAAGNVAVNVTYTLIENV